MEASTEMAIYQRVEIPGTHNLLLSTSREGVVAGREINKIYSSATWFDILKPSSLFIVNFPSLADNVDFLPSKRLDCNGR